MLPEFLPSIFSKKKKTNSGVMKFMQAARTRPFPDEVNGHPSFCRLTALLVLALHCVGCRMINDYGTGDENILHRGN
jgi:hypothetical protein